MKTLLIIAALAFGPAPDAYYSGAGFVGPKPGDYYNAPTPAVVKPCRPVVPPPAEELEEVYYYTALFDCVPCRWMERDISLVTVPGIKFIKADSQDPWVFQQKDGFPFLRWKVKGKWTGYQSGWKGMTAFTEKFCESQGRTVVDPRDGFTKRIDGLLEKLDQKRQQDNKAKKPIILLPEKKPQASSGHYPTHSGMVYNVEGNWHPSRSFLIQHLQRGQHAGKFSASWLNSLSYQELVSLHDDDHLGRLRSSKARVKARNTL